MATDKIASDIQSLSPSAKIELFVLDYTNLDVPGILRFHAGTNHLGGNIVWQGQTYTALPIAAEGFDTTTKGTLARPRIKVANTAGIFSAEVANNDLVDCKVIRKRTLAKYLDAVNFPSGNAYADPNQHLPDDIWYVDQKISENRYIIEWELASVFDLSGVMLPYRQVVQNYCPWRYRGSECGYTGNAYFDANDVSVPLIAGDTCGKRLTSCKARFGNGVLPFGGFPGTQRYG